MNTTRASNGQSNGQWAELEAGRQLAYSQTLPQQKPHRHPHQNGNGKSSVLEAAGAIPPRKPRSSRRRVGNPLRALTRAVGHVATAPVRAVARTPAFVVSLPMHAGDTAAFLAGYVFDMGVGFSLIPTALVRYTALLPVRAVQAVAPATGRAAGDAAGAAGRGAGASARAAGRGATRVVHASTVGVARAAARAIGALARAQVRAARKALRAAPGAAAAAARTPVVRFSVAVAVATAAATNADVVGKGLGIAAKHVCTAAKQVKRVPVGKAYRAVSEQAKRVPVGDACVLAVHAAKSVTEHVKSAIPVGEGKSEVKGSSKRAPQPTVWTKSYPRTTVRVRKEGAAFAEDPAGESTRPVFAKAADTARTTGRPATPPPASPTQFKVSRVKKLAGAELASLGMG